MFKTANVGEKGKVAIAIAFLLKRHALSHLFFFFFNSLKQLRVVTQEDVRFQRFRRDDVGVFELKGMIEKNTERVAAAEQVAADNEDKL